MKIMRAALFVVLPFMLLVVCKKAENKEIKKEEKKVQINYDEIYKKKGLYDMKYTLKPEIIHSPYGINAVMGLSTQNTLATVNSKGEFCLLTISKEGTLDMQPIVSGYPESFGNKYYSDSISNVLWMQRGRGVYTLDVESKKTGFVMATDDLMYYANPTHVVDKEKKYLLINLEPSRPLPYFYLIFDVLNNKVVKKSGEFAGEVLPFYGNNLLSIKGVPSEWKITDYEHKKETDNKLTKKLTKLQMDVAANYNVIHLGRRMIFAKKDTEDDTILFSIRWDEKMEDIKVQPLIAQVPKDTGVNSRANFSYDGNWLQSKLYHFNSMIDEDRIVIYHISNNYPQGVSLPIMCGYTKGTSKGAFMNHSEWGMCYVDYDIAMDKLFVYKLNDGLKLLAEQAAAKAKKAVGK